MAIDFPPTHLENTLQHISLALPGFHMSSDIAPVVFGFSSKGNGAYQAFIYSTQQYGLLKRNYEERTITLTQKALDLLYDRNNYQKNFDVAFTPKLFKWLFEKSNKNLSLTRKEIKLICKVLMATEHEIAVITRSYYNTLKYLNHVHIGLN